LVYSPSPHWLVEFGVVTPALKPLGPLFSCGLKKK